LSRINSPASTCSTVKSSGKFDSKEQYFNET
jgi:hypothetical protein